MIISEKHGCLQDIGLDKIGWDHVRVGQVMFCQPCGALGTTNQSRFPLSTLREGKDSFHSESVLPRTHKDHGHCKSMAQGLGKTPLHMIDRKKCEWFPLLRSLTATDKAIRASSALSLPSSLPLFL